MSRRVRPAGRTRAGRRRHPIGRWVIVLVLVVAAALVAVRIVRPPAPRGAPGAGPGGAAVEVFFVRTEPGGRAQTLASVVRPAAPGPVDARLAGAIRWLLAGPSNVERARGLTSEIPPGTVLRSATVRGGIATIDLGPAFAQGGGSSSMLGRVWQVVYTATQFPGVSAAQLLVDGRRAETLGGEGVMIGAPLRRTASPPTF